MDSEKENKIEWLYCNQCLRQTRHEVIFVKRVEETEEMGDHFGAATWVHTHTMLECRGCGAITLRKRTNSVDMGVDVEALYPPRVARRMPSWAQDLPSDLESLLRETYAALYADSRRLAVMGARAIVDVFMNMTIGDVGGFKAKLNALVDDGRLSRQHQDILDAALDAGHAVIHRGHNPGSDDVNAVMDIVESLLQSYSLSTKSERLRKQTPTRCR